MVKWSNLTSPTSGFEHIKAGSGVVVNNTYIIAATCAADKRKPTESLDAYDCFLRGMANFHRPPYANREAIAEALHFFKRAIELDAEFASAYAMAAYCYVRSKVFGLLIEPANEVTEAGRLAQRAMELGRDNALAVGTAGMVFAYVVRDLDTSGALVDRALTLNPNLAAVWWYSGYVKLWLGDPNAAVERFARAMRLSPLDHGLPRMQAAMADALIHAERYDEASMWAAMAIREAPDYHNGLRAAAVSNALAGKVELAQKSTARLRQLDPALRVSTLREIQGPYRRPEDIARYEEAMRKAGLPG